MITMFRCPASAILILILASVASGAMVVVDDDGAGNFTTIQEAINASETGEVIVVLNGTYAENLVVDRPIVLKGEGDPVVKGSGLLDPLITVTSINVTLEGLTFSGSLNDGHDACSVLVLEDGCKLLNCTISGSSGNGLILRDSTGHIVSGNQIHDNQHNGVCVTRANFSRLLDNQVFRNGESGVVLEGSEYGLLAQNEVRENGEVGLHFVGSSYNQVAYNRVRLNAEDSMHLIDSSHTAIVENEIHDNGHNGIILHHAQVNVLSNNVIQGSGEEGLLVIGYSDGNIFTGNALYENGLNGISISESYFNTVSQNEVFDNEYSGISLRDNSSSIMLSDNEIRGNKLYGFYLEDSNQNIIERNDVQGNLHGVIMARSADNTLVDNKIHDNHFGTSMEFVDSVSMSNNYLYNNSDYGVLLKSCDRSRLWENRILENGGDGVQTSGSKNLLVYRNLIANNSKYGIQLLDHTTETIFMYNVIQHNGGGGMYIYEAEINLITGNIFVDNQNFNARDSGQVSNWLANFYSDYSGEAIGGGVAGAEPYVITGRRGAVTFDLNPIVIKEWLEERGPD